MKDTLYIIIPAYNEEETIGAVIDEWNPVVERHNGNGRSRLLVINDGSRDKTQEIVEQKCLDFPLLSIVTKENAGHGAAILYGYQLALKMGADYIFQTDSDGQTEPNEFEQFWNWRKKYDMVIGHRKRREDGFLRIIVTKVLRITILAMFGTWICDANTPFRLMYAKSLAKYIERIPDNYNLSNVLISVIFAKEGLRVKYLPITFKARQGGCNSLDLKKIFKLGLSAVKDFFFLRKII